jgi:hypothetical protein
MYGDEPEVGPIGLHGPGAKEPDVRPESEEQKHNRSTSRAPPAEKVRRNPTSMVPPKPLKMSEGCKPRESPDSLPKGTCCGPGGIVMKGRHEPGRSRCKNWYQKII